MMRRIVPRQRHDAHVSHRCFVRFTNTKSPNTKPLPMPGFFPYGLASFREVRTNKLFWCDNSKYIHDVVEEGADHQLFLRPPRWGKSLFMDMLRCYLDVNMKKDFDKLFKGTDIHKRKKELRHRNKYHVMKFDFSVQVRSNAAPAEIEREFDQKIGNAVEDFCLDYDVSYGAFTSPLAKMERVINNAIMTKDAKVFLLIDEYDRFANKLMLENADKYAKIVKGVSGDPHSSPLRSFFEAIKAVNVRSFTTGITPIALADASGANMIKDLTHLPAFGEMCGFRKADVVRGVKGVLGDTHEAVDRIVRLMDHYYNGYRFRGTEKNLLTSPLYNTQLCLYFLDRMCGDPDGFGDSVVNEWSIDPTKADTQELLDPNVAVSENVTRVLAKHETLPYIQAHLARGSLRAKVNERLRLRELQEYSSADSLHRLSTFLFHHGLVTLKTVDTVCVPNRLVEDPAKGLLSHLQPMITNWNLDVGDLVENPTVEKIWRLLRTILDGLGTKFDKSFSEGAVQAVVEGVLRVLPDKLGGVSVHCEEEFDPPPGPTPKCYKCRRLCKVKTAGPTSQCPGRKYWKCCEDPAQPGQRKKDSFQWFPRKRMGMYFKSGNDVVLLEFKRLRPGNVVRIDPPIDPAITWKGVRATSADDRALAGGGCVLAPEMPDGVTTLQQLEHHAKAQCKEYVSGLTAKGLTVKMACTVVHWTHHENAPSCVLVSKVG